MSFAQDGYAVLPGFLSEDALASIRRAMAGLMDSPHDPSCERPNNTLVPLRWNDPVVDIILSDAARVRWMGESVGAQDLRWISGYVSVKDPHSPPLWWHQDWWCWDHPISRQQAPVQVALLCYLSDTHPGNGALRVLPGSHVRSSPLHPVLPEAHGDESVALDLEHPAMRDQPGQQTVALRAGDAVVTDYRLLHGTHGNGSDLRRDCVLLSFTPSWSYLPDDLRAHLISHPALPGRHEQHPMEGWTTRLLPRFDGVRADLALNRNAPAEF